MAKTVCIFRYAERILTKLESLESPRCQLSRESSFVKIRSVYRKIQTVFVNHFYNRYIPLFRVRGPLGTLPGVIFVPSPGIPPGVPEEWFPADGRLRGLKQVE